MLSCDALRDLGAVVKAAEDHGLRHVETAEMLANDLCVMLRKGSA
jgi:hypothetical protein